MHAQSLVLLALQGLTYTVKSSFEKGKMLKLLDNVTGYFEPGEMCALMGPSGRGVGCTLVDTNSNISNNHMPH